MSQTTIGPFEAGTDPDIGPDPTPDENGVLQPPYVEIARDWRTPDGDPLLSDGSIQTDDFAECGLTQDALS